MRRLLLPLFALLAALHGAGPALTLSTPEKSLAFTAAEFAALPHIDLAVADPRDQHTRHFTGVPVRELLAKVDAPLGDKLRGPALQLAVVFRAKDGYGVVFALAEFDEAFSTRALLLADQENGRPLEEKAAPFQLIAPGDKKAARWGCMITSIEIVSLARVTPATSVKP